MTKRQFVTAFLLALFFRAITLEYPDLIDPSEGRYAFVGQEMFLSGDWIVPKLPWEGQIEPYLGKPPFHFWLMATSFALFGMDEWAVRLPSFVALLVMCFALLGLRRFSELREVVLPAAVTLASSVLIFFMSGAAVVDVTLAACVTVAFCAAYHWIRTEEGGRYIPGIMVAIGLGLGFLTKGPIALLMVGLPALMWVVVTRRSEVLSRPPWILAIVVFLAITVPWFVLAQQRNPDFLRYFFINENVGRYLKDDYGDRYGTGHQYPFGTIWTMFALGFLPWTVPLVMALWSHGRRLGKLSFWRERPALLFFGCWALSPAIIFTFARQLHAAYVLPGVPGLAVFMMLLLKEENVPGLGRCYRIFTSIAIMVALTGGVIGVCLGTTVDYAVRCALPFATLVWAGYHVSRNSAGQFVVAISVVAAYAFVTLSLADELGERRSTEPILRCLTHYSSQQEPVIGVVNSNSYSLYFYSRAWTEELEKSVKVEFLKSAELPATMPEDLVIRTNELERIRGEIPASYLTVASVGRWTWLRRGGAEAPMVECPKEIL